MRAMNDHDCETKDRLHTEITRLKSELESEQDCSESLRIVRDRLQSELEKCRVENEQLKQGLAGELHTSEQRVKELVEAYVPTLKALRVLVGEWEFEEREYLNERHPGSAAGEITVGNVIEGLKAIATLHKAIGEVGS